MTGQRLLVASLAVLVIAGQSAAQDRSVGEQIGDALLAAPSSMREGATVLGYGGSDRPGDALSLLRERTGDLICLADDPSEDGFHVACYHRSLDPFMALGRTLRASGHDRSEVMAERYAALTEGRLTMPDRAALYSVSAEQTPSTGSDVLEGERRLVVVYVPGATGEELGLPTRPEGNAPWLMLSGTPWAHIMISR